LSAIQGGNKLGSTNAQGLLFYSKNPTSNLSKKSILGYSLYFTGLHDKFQKGAAMSEHICPKNISVIKV